MDNVESSAMTMGCQNSFMLHSHNIAIDFYILIFCLVTWPSCVYLGGVFPR